MKRYHTKIYDILSHLQEITELLKKNAEDEGGVNPLAADHIKGVGFGLYVPALCWRTSGHSLLLETIYITLVRLPGVRFVRIRRTGKGSAFAELTAGLAAHDQLEGTTVVDGDISANGMHGMNMCFIHWSHGHILPIQIDMAFF